MNSQVIMALPNLAYRVHLAIFVDELAAYYSGRSISESDLLSRMAREGSRNRETALGQIGSRRHNFLSSNIH
jgi:hypothetical protein